MMKNMLLAGAALLTIVSGSAMAADMRPARAPIYTKAPMMAPAFSWTGCYIGGNAGGLWATKDWSGLTRRGSADVSGGVAGGQVGCNYQVTTWVFGIQGDFDWTNASGDATDTLFAQTDHAKSEVAGVGDRPRRLRLGPVPRLCEGWRSLGNRRLQHLCSPFRHLDA